MTRHVFWRENFVQNIGEEIT